ncbi:MAG: ABC transporter substrate-binding protein [Pseudomonadota bacterium]|nr:ABC transporter substrate-binding protein [Pseudomonadota bacterium]
MNTNLQLMIHKLKVLLSICVIAALPTAPVEAAMTPTQTMKEAVSGVLKILKDDRLNREQRWLEIGKIIDTRFDFRSMSQSILATNWRTATAEEKRRFVEFFSQYLEDTYRTKIEAYTGQRVEYLGEQVRKDRAIVDTQIVADKVRIPITYRLKNNDGEWFAYDVVIAGISLVNNYRSTFSAIIKSEGMDGLLLDLEGRIASYKEKHGGLPPE